MGRAARMPRPMMEVNTRICRKVHSNYTHVVARCWDSAGSTTFTDYEMPREMSAAPDWMVGHMKRRRLRCNARECDAASAPAWKTDNGRDALPHGPEVSYGIPFRWSASRLLASDVKSALCSALASHRARRYHNDTDECNALLSVSEWSTEGFLKSFADGTLPSLFSSAVRNHPNFTLQPSLMELHRYMMGMEPPSSSPALSSILQRPDEDYLLWNGPDAPGWVACDQKNRTCHGKIAKATWYQSPKKRADACISVFQQQVKQGNVKSSAVGIDICNLNSKTNQLCQIMKQAQGKVFEANCIFAGVCAPQVFVYSPGTYSSSNQDFVRGTVSSFYEMFKQVSMRRSDPDEDEEREYRAFAFSNQTSDDEMVSAFRFGLAWHSK